MLTAGVTGYKVYGDRECDVEGREGHWETVVVLTCASVGGTRPLRSVKANVVTADNIIVFRGPGGCLLIYLISVLEFFWFYAARPH